LVESFELQYFLKIYTALTILGPLMRILLVEDEPILRSSLKEFLETNRFQVDSFDNGSDACHAGMEYAYDAAVVDAGLPDIDGFDVVKKWRSKQREFPVIFLTARDSQADIIKGLTEVGANDYTVKPCDPNVLLARIKVHIKAYYRMSSYIIKADPLCIDLDKQEASLDGKVLKLSPYEYRTLEVLIKNPGKVFSKKVISDHIYSLNEEPETNSIEVFISRLRAQLSPNKSNNPIETIRNKGYKFVWPINDVNR